MTKCFGLLVLALIVFAGSNAHSTRAAGIATELLTPSRASNPPAEPKSKRSDPDRDAPTDAADEDRSLSLLESGMAKFFARHFGFGKTSDKQAAGVKAHLDGTGRREMENPLTKMSDDMGSRPLLNLDTELKNVERAKVKLRKVEDKAATSKQKRDPREVSPVRMAKVDLKLAEMELGNARRQLDDLEIPLWNGHDIEAIEVREMPKITRGIGARDDINEAIRTGVAARERSQGIVKAAVLKMKGKEDDPLELVSIFKELHADRRHYRDALRQIDSEMPENEINRRVVLFDTAGVADTYRLQGKEGLYLKTMREIYPNDPKWN